MIEVYEFQLLIQQEPRSMPATKYNVDMTQGRWDRVRLVNHTEECRDWMLGIGEAVDIEHGWRSGIFSISDSHGMLIAHFRSFLFYSQPWHIPNALYWPGEDDGPIVLLMNRVA